MFNSNVRQAKYSGNEPYIFPTSIVASTVGHGMIRSSVRVASRRACEEGSITPEILRWLPGCPVIWRLGLTSGAHSYPKAQINDRWTQPPPVIKASTMCDERVREFPKRPKRTTSAKAEQSRDNDATFMGYFSL